MSMSVYDLSREQLNELKDSLFWQIYNLDNEIPPFCIIDKTQPYTKETLPDCPDDIPDDIIFHVYAGISFVPDDFFCTAE